MTPTHDSVADRRPRPTMRDLLDRETRSVPVELTTEGLASLPTEDIANDRYWSRAFHDLEIEHVWKKTWQIACREEDIPEVGDMWVYEVASLSVLIVRSAADEIKAYANSCLHRGTLLRAAPGHASELRCQFHGFCWNLNGSLKYVPCEWDFPQLQKQDMNLPEYQVDTFGGFVFVNMDLNAAPLAEYMGGLADHLEAVARPKLEERFKAAHVQKVLRCNWKVAMEAFIESFHVTSTHPQVLPWAGDTNSQYDVFPGERHWSRMLTPSGVPSPALPADVGSGDVAESLFKDFLGMDLDIEVPPGADGRSALADALRAMPMMSNGYDTSELTDSQVLDSIQYFLFPNWTPFVGLLINLAYRFLPYGDDPEMCVMDIMMLIPFPDGVPRPPAPKPRVIDADTPLHAAAELGVYGQTMCQDMDNVWRVQKGLRAAVKPGITPSYYQESRIRHLHALIDEYIGV